MKIDHKDSYEDFGKQFIKDSKIDDYWGSKKMLKDIVNPFALSKIKNKIIMEVGTGSGRILNNLTKYYPKKIFAVESDLFAINTIFCSFSCTYYHRNFCWFF